MHGHSRSTSHPAVESLEDRRCLSHVLFELPTNNDRVPDSESIEAADVADLVAVFQAGRYKDLGPGVVPFEHSDWNRDGRFALAAKVEPQYIVYQTPRLQPGNSPLIGTPDYTGTDQVDILWQTKTVGTGQVDSFEVSYRRANATDSWQPALLNAPLEVGEETRIVHSATIRGLAWDANYEYRVLHLRG